MSTFLQLTQRLRRESGRSGSGVTPTSLIGAANDDLRLADWINDAWIELQTGPDRWKWQRQSAVGSTVVNQLQYAPAAFGATGFYKMKHDNGDYRVTAFDPAASGTEWPLVYLPYDQFRQIFMAGGTITPGLPNYWSYTPGDQILIGPKTPTVYSVRYDYYTGPVNLLVDTDLPLHPAQFHVGLVWRALMEAGVYDGAGEVYTRGENNYKKVMHELERDQREELNITMGSLA